MVLLDLLLVPLLSLLDDMLPNKARKIIGTILLSIGLIMSIIGVAVLGLFRGLENTSGLGGVGGFVAFLLLVLGITISIIASTFFMKNLTETFDEILAEEDSESA